MEEWKNYNENYLVSDLGRVRSLFTNKILTQSKANGGYLKVNLSRKTISVHKLVAIVWLDHVPNGYIEVVDHINGNPADNKASNLRLITNRENTSKIRGKSRFVGVHWSKAKSKWQSRILIDGKRHHLGYFDNEIDAGEAYKQKLKSIV
jgi:hypothetical protein